MKRILVTGGAGFLGAHLCARLIQEGHYVICLDNLSSGRRRNVQSLLQHPNFEMLFHDVVTPLEIKVDQIYNLACPASPVQYQADPIKTAKTSVLGALNLLDLATRTGARILQASTSEIYGDPQIHPQPESYRGCVNPIGIRACYDEGKRMAETLFFDYYRQYHVDIRVVRIFNTYGPGMDPNDGRVVSNFIVQALDSKDISVYGDGSQTRSFCYINDLIEGLYRMMETPDLTGPVNLGNPDEFTILELAEKVLYLTDSKAKVVYHPLPSDDPTQRKPVITLAKQRLDWEPTISLDEGLRKTIAYFKAINQ